MIRIVRLAGESYDLETGTQLPKALILSNGVREFALHVDDDTAMAVVHMMAEGQQALDEAVAEAKVPGNGSGEPIEEPPRLREVEPPTMASVVDDEAEEEDSLEREPGEEYNDPATGVGSL